MMKESINRRGAMGLAGAGIVAAFLASRPGSARPGRQFEVARTPADWRRILIVELSSKGIVIGAEFDAGDVG